MGHPHRHVITSYSIHYTKLYDVVAVGPVAIPDYLDRPQILTRSGPSELQLAEFERWAGSLEKDVSRVLAENLSTLLEKDHVIVLRSRITSYNVCYTKLLRLGLLCRRDFRLHFFGRGFPGLCLLGRGLFALGLLGGRGFRVHLSGHGFSYNFV